MNISIDASRAFVSERTGTENYSYQLIRAIAKIDQKNRYTLFTRCHLNMPELRWHLNKNFVVKPITTPRLWTQIGLAKEVFFHPPDVLFIPSHTIPMIHLISLKTVVTIHDLGYEYLPQYHQFPQKLYLNKSTEFAVKQATHLIAVSKATKKDLINKLNCPAEKITVIYEGFDKTKFKPVIRHSGNERSEDSRIKKNGFWTSQNDKSTNRYILFVGTIQPRKNIVRLIEAFAKVIVDTNNLQLVIAGNKGWLYDEILKTPEKLGIADRVKFLGYTSDDDLASLYSSALCLCLPSLFEGFG
ncbi:glycosyltransferase family 4 protein, partial [Candidatus Gottesmanbacteria bacterium]|nr:glycosyltransferase family 4 protein [Candidatus Gottesmanbacteria bacterium]